MLNSGVTCARLDLTWGTIDFHRRSLANLNTAMSLTKRLCAVWMDTTGREILVRRETESNESGWPRLEGSLTWTAGQKVIITGDTEVACTADVLPITVPGFTSLVEVGSDLQVSRYLASGAENASLMLEVVDKRAGELHCVAQNDATVEGVLIVTVSHTQFDLEMHDSDLNKDLPLMTEFDIQCIKAFASEFEIDFISLSYCNTSEDVYECRNFLDTNGLTQTKIIAKVERKAAIHNFERIAAASDGIILSRGNLGLDFEPEAMALLQKKCITRCNGLGKPIIVTRFVDTMVGNPRPTRAEATDVANAVLDGADGIMLGAETLRGLYPIDTVMTVVRLCCSAEAYFDYRTHHEEIMGEAFEEEVSLKTISSFSSMPRLVPTQSSLDLSVQQDGSGRGRMIRGHSAGNLFADTTPMHNANGDTSSSREGTRGAHPNGGLAANGLEVGSPAGDAGELDTPHGQHKVSSFGTLPATVVGSMADLGFGNLARVKSQQGLGGEQYMSKLESIASGAVRSAEKINAGLIIVLAQSGRTASLVAKYRPPMPILVVCVPTLRSNKGLGWQLDGKYLVRQCLILRGVHPSLAAPLAQGAGDDLLEEAICVASARGLIRPNQYAVAIMSQKGGLVVKIVQSNATGDGIQPLNNKGIADEDEDILDRPSGGSAVLPGIIYAGGGLKK